MADQATGGSVPPPPKPAKHSATKIHKLALRLMVIHDQTFRRMAQ